MQLYKLIQQEFKIQEIFPSRLANLINKHVLMHSDMKNLMGNSSCILNSGNINCSSFHAKKNKKQKKTHKILSYIFTVIYNQFSWKISFK